MEFSVNAPHSRPPGVNTASKLVGHFFRAIAAGRPAHSLRQPGGFDSFSRMGSIHDDAAALKALQDDIYRERILRARRMTVQERLADVFELSNSVFTRMHEGAMWQLGTTDPELGWREVRRRLARLDRVHDAGRFLNYKPTTA